MSRSNPFAFNAPRGGAFRQLTKKPAHSSAVHKLAQRVVNTGKGSHSNRVNSSAHRDGRISLRNHPAPKFGPGGFTIGPRGRLKVNNGNFDGSYPGESGLERGQKGQPVDRYKKIYDDGLWEDDSYPGESGLEPGQKGAPTAADLRAARRKRRMEA